MDSKTNSIENIDLIMKYNKMIAFLITMAKYRKHEYMNVLFSKVTGEEQILYCADDNCLRAYILLKKEGHGFTKRFV